MSSTYIWLFFVSKVVEQGEKIGSWDMGRRGETVLMLSQFEGMRGDIGMMKHKEAQSTDVLFIFFHHIRPYCAHEGISTSLPLPYIYARFYISNTASVYSIPTSSLRSSGASRKGPFHSVFFFAVLISSLFNQGEVYKGLPVSVYISRARRGHVMIKAAQAVLHSAHIRRGLLPWQEKLVLIRREDPIFSAR